MFKRYKCTFTGKYYKVWAKPSGCFQIVELWGDHYEYVSDLLPTTLILDES